LLDVLIRSASTAAFPPSSFAIFASFAIEASLAKSHLRSSAQICGNNPLKFVLIRAIRGPTKTARLFFQNLACVSPRFFNTYASPYC
jgi:hypothetical protein